MKKKMNELNHGFKPTKFYLDDIQQVLEIFREVSPDVSIWVKGYGDLKFDELANLEEKETHDCYISIQEPNMSLQLIHGETWLRSSEDSVVATGIFEKIKHFVSKRQVGPLSLFWIIFFISIFFAPFHTFFFYGVYVSKFSIIFLACSVIAHSGIGWYFISLFSDKHSTVIFEYRKDRPSFLQRNWEQIKLQILTGIISAVSGALLFWIIQKLLGWAP